MKDLTTSEKAWKIRHWFLSWLNKRSFGSGSECAHCGSTLIFPLCANCSHSCTTIKPCFFCNAPSHQSTMWTEEGERSKTKNICTTLRLECDPITCGKGHQSLLVWFYGLKPSEVLKPMGMRSRVLSTWQDSALQLLGNYLRGREKPFPIFGPGQRTKVVVKWK